MRLLLILLVLALASPVAVAEVQATEAAAELQDAGEALPVTVAPAAGGAPSERAVMSLRPRPLRPLPASPPPVPPPER
jgi:hypothetical protein